MIPEIKKILYATDLSANSIYAFRYAINSAMKHNAEIVILHVVEPLPPGMQMVLGACLAAGIQTYLIEEKMRDRRNQIKEGLKNFYEKELEQDSKGADRVKTIEICEGYPEEEILNKADELNCDVIIMGTHGKGPVEHTFFGSTAQKILRRVRKPVFIVPLPKGEVDIIHYEILPGIGHENRCL